MDSFLRIVSILVNRETVKALIEEWGSLWEGHLWFATSGSSNQKWVGISKTAFLNSAKAVNQHVESTSSLGIEADLALVSVPDLRLGVIGLAHTGCPCSVREHLIELFNQHVLPFEKIRLVQELVRIPRSPLQKLMRNELREAFTKQSY